MSLEITIENVRWPEESGNYKVVQFIVDDKPYLRFGKSFHTYIVRNFADEVGAAIITQRTTLGQIHLFADKERYRMVGAGRCEFDKARRVAKFYEAKLEYGLGINQEHLALIMALYPYMNVMYGSNKLGI